MTTTQGSGVATTLTAHTNANEKNPSYMTLISSLSASASALLVTVSSDGGLEEDFLIDVAYGTASSEVNIIENLLYSEGSNQWSASVLLPVSVNSGERISARCQSTTASDTVRVSVTAFLSPFNGGTVWPSITTIGAVDTADTAGVSITPGASAAEGNWVQITSGLAGDIQGFFFALGSQTSTALDAARYFLDIGITSTPTSSIIVENYQTGSAVNEHHTPRISPWIPVALDSGEEIHARMSSTNATPNGFDIVLYTVPRIVASAGNLSGIVLPNG